jgi:hypothetical protein
MLYFKSIGIVNWWSTVPYNAFRLIMDLLLFMPRLDASVQAALGRRTTDIKNSCLPRWWAGQRQVRISHELSPPYFELVESICCIPWKGHGLISPHLLNTDLKIDTKNPKLEVFIVKFNHYLNLLNVPSSKRNSFSYDKDNVQQNIALR